MSKKTGQKILFGVIALALSGILGLSFGSAAHADANADLVWERCGAVATDSVFYYDCAKTALGMEGELAEHDVMVGSELYNRLGGEESRGSFSFSDATNILKNTPSPSELDREATNCTKDASGWGWFACGLNKAAGGITAFVYPKIQELMMTDPAIFEASTMHTAWSRFQIFANIILVVIIMVMIVSQITGMGISNYGIKKNLPRVVAMVLVLNLSFFLCRMAIDIANIIGDGIGAVFDGLTAAAKAKIDFDALADGSSKTLMTAKIIGGGVITGISAFFATKTALASGQSITLLIMTALIAAIIGLLMLLTIIQLRKALIIILTITSPVAVLLYVLPGTKKLFNQWFGLFKGLLFAYPVCALLVKGGNFASTILTAAMGVANEDGSPNFFTMIIAVAASIVPIFLIPNTIIKSAGALGAKLQGLARKLSGSLSGGLRNTKIGQRLDRGAKERSNRMKAGINRNGDKAKLGRLTRSRSERQRMDAAKRAQQDRALHRSEDNAGEMANYEEMEQIANATEERLSSYDKGAMEGEVMKILQGGGDATTIAAELSGAIKHWNTVNDKNNADEVVAGYLDSLDDGAYAQELRREIARKRLSDSDGILKAKHGAMRQYYRALASDTAPTGDAARWRTQLKDENGNPVKDDDGKDIYTSNQWVDSLLKSDSFNAEWLAGVSRPQSEQLQTYMETASKAVSPNTPEWARVEENKRQIATTYAQMKTTKAYQKATPGDYDGLEQAINKYNAPPPPTP